MDLEMGSTLSRFQREAMELDRDLMSSSSLSSSESDAGVYTNDEGREGNYKILFILLVFFYCEESPHWQINCCFLLGDDEQSDCFGETRRDEDTDFEPDESTLQSILNGPLEHMSTNVRQVL